MFKIRPYLKLNFDINGKEEKKTTQFYYQNVSNDDCVCFSSSLCYIILKTNKICILRFLIIIFIYSTIRIMWHSLYVNICLKYVLFLFRIFKITQNCKQNESEIVRVVGKVCTQKLHKPGASKRDIARKRNSHFDRKSKR